MLFVDILGYLVELRLLREAPGQTEVTQFHVAGRVYQEIGGLDIPMYDTCRVEIA